jgi:hypothetical protein
MKYAKAILATIIAILAALVTALGTSPQQNLGHFDARTWWTVIGAIIASGAFTWWVQNVDGLAGGIIKAVAAGGGAFVTAIIAAYADNIISQAELIGAVSAALVALLAVYQTPNTVRAVAARVNR